MGDAVKLGFLFSRLSGIRLPFVFLPSLLQGRSAEETRGMTIRHEFSGRMKLLTHAIVSEKSTLFFSASA
jgi:hypothetical protein